MTTNFHGKAKNFPTGQSEYNVLSEQENLEGGENN